MCTTTNETTTSEETTQEPRDINVLLSLETYQGMTDAEIDLVLNYKIDRALSDRELLAKIAAITNKQEQCIADNLASAQAARDMLQSIIDRTFPTVPIEEPLRFSPDVTEV